MLSLVTMPRRALPEESAHLDGAADVPRPEGAAIQVLKSLTRSLCLTLTPGGRTPGGRGDMPHFGGGCHPGA